MYEFERIIYRLVQACRCLADAFVELVWPTRCAGCEKLGVLLCDTCRQELTYIDQHLACPCCGAPFGDLVCTECTPVYEPTTMAFSQARCALEFTELSRRIIITYKDRGEQRLAPLLAEMIAQVIPLEWKLWADVLTWIPADANAVKRRGFDHMALIAVSMAEQTGLRIRPLLVKHSRKDQRSLNRKQREQNMGSVFSVLTASPANGRSITDSSSASSHPPRNIILIDDVFTTGATLHAASQALLSAGAREVRVVTVCRVW